MAQSNQKAMLLSANSLKGEEIMRFVPVFAVLAIASPAYSLDFTPQATQKAEVKSIVKSPEKGLILDLSDTLVFRGEVDDETISKAIFKLNTMTSDTVTIFIDSPGGSVVAGTALLQAITSSNKKIRCVASFAASMAFITFQACPERIVMDNSILMSHVPSVGLGGAQLPNLTSFYNLWVRYTQMIDAAVAKRMQLTVEKYKALIRDDLWLIGEESLKIKAADRIENVVCSPEMYKKTFWEDVKVFFFTFRVEWSSCPLVTYPLSIVVPDMSGGKGGSEKTQVEINKALENRLFNYKTNRDYIIELNSPKFK